MVEPPAAEDSRAAVAEILRTLGVSRVISVDDAYREAVTVEAATVAATGLDENALRLSLPELGDSIPADPDVKRALIRRVLGELDDAGFSDRARVILASEAGEGAQAVEDIANASLLREIIPPEVFTALSPRMWQRERERLVHEGVGTRTLYLFDQDLSGQGGERDGGIRIISSIMAGADPAAVICGLLTHTVTEASYFGEWQRLGAQHSIPLEQFLVIPKRILGSDPMMFAQALKFLALLPDFSALQKAVAELLQRAADRAATRIRAINVYDLDHIVMEASASEGLWEPEMLFRLHGLFQRLEARRLAHQDTTLEDIASRLRAVSLIPTKTRFKPASGVWQIQRNELYEDARDLNAYLLPVDLGDIFVMTKGESKKYYILLAQPCDLMVRAKGDREPRLVHVPLVEIGQSEKSTEYHIEVPYFGAGPDEKWTLRLKQAHQVRIHVLDLCALNADGRSTLLLEGDAPAGLRPAWRARHKVLKKWARLLVSRLDLVARGEGDGEDVSKFKEHLRPELEHAFLEEGTFSGTVVGEKEDRALVFNCHRESRLTRARAFDLLGQYVGCMSRPAHDADFGQNHGRGD